MLTAHHEQLNCRRTLLISISCIFWLIIGLHQTPAWAASMVKGIVISKTNPVENTASQTFDSYITLTNISKKKPIQGPLALVIKSINRKGVSVVAPDGTLNNKPYLYIPLTTGILAPQQTLGEVVIRFRNPSKKTFKFVPQVITQLPGIIPSLPNHQPVAHAGESQTVTVGNTAQLNGSASSDPEGQALTYQWSVLEKPQTSNAQLTVADQPLTGLPIDQPGQYRLQLVVNDGQIAGFPDTVVLDTQNSAPVADAGLPVTSAHRSTVTLNASASHDKDAQTLTHAWSLPRKPSGSKAKINPLNVENPTLTLDKKGDYMARLIVSDGQQTSDPATVIISTRLSLPVAHAGSDIGPVLPQQSVQLNGVLSSDSDQDPLTYRWSLLYKPEGSTVQLSDADKQQCQFTPDTTGDYIAQLMVHDGHFNSAPDTVLVKVRDGDIQPVNQAPKITSTAVTTASVEKLYTYDVDASDVDSGDILSYALTALPAGMSINSQTGIINWTPTASQVGSQAITVNVTDGKGGSDSQSFTISVSLADQTTVPILVDQSRSSAEAAIQQAKLNLGALTFQHNNKAEGSVISQTPIAGSGVKIGTAVNITVSIGPDNGLPPNPVTIAPKLDPTVAATTFGSTHFLYTGSNPVQTGVQPGTIELERAAVIRGRVLDKQNNPLSGITVTVKDHPEFGQTFSRMDGWFDMAVNGGGYLTINYQKTGFLPVQRQLNVAWQDYAIAEDVVLIGADSRVTTISLSNNIQGVQVVQGSVITDKDGNRQATVLFPRGTTATMSLPNGSSQPLEDLHVRATEYTVGPNGPNSMPGPLPPPSAYTYAVELSVDEAITAGATDVQFSQPLPFYVDNFIGFPVGTIVPAGWYDKQKAAWIPSDNGKVIKILNESQGFANIDSDGDDQVDNLLGLTDDERSRLAEIYQPGKTLWRVPIQHFTPWDLNWPYGPPNGATEPKVPEPKSTEDENNRTDEPNCIDGSIIECENQTLGETLPINGTPFTLNYRSDRQTGRKTKLTIPLTGSTLPNGVKRVVASVDYGGRHWSQVFNTQPNQTHELVLEDQNIYGQNGGFSTAKVTVGYVYGAVYNQSWMANRAFGRMSGEPLVDTDRFEITLQTKTIVPTVNRSKTSATPLGGWSLDILHSFDPESQVLYLGNGSRRSKFGVISPLTTVAGDGTKGSNGDGGLAASASLNSPADVAVGNDNSIYISDASLRIRRVDSTGIITTVAGDGVNGFSAEGEPVDRPIWKIATGPDGSLYFAQKYRLSRVAPNGIITTVAGIGPFDANNQENYTINNGDGGPATSAPIGPINGIAVAPDNSIYVSSPAFIRKIDSSGIINTVAGTLSPYIGMQDGVPATSSKIYRPRGMCVASDGSLIFADEGHNRVRRIDTSGIVTTFAGNKFNMYQGDGVLATQTYVNGPEDVACDRDGSVYIADNDNRRIRRVGGNGTITTVAGNGSSGFSGDNIPATKSSLGGIFGIALSRDGAVFMADISNHRIRKISTVMPRLSHAEIKIASEDGQEVYVFNNEGRHLRTINASTSSTIYNFTYDGIGHLTKITDSNGNNTTVEWSATGSPSAIFSPYGLRTTLTANDRGYIDSLTNAAGESYIMEYTADGLLTKFTDPLGHASLITYDEMGRLVRDQNAAGGFKSLTRTERDSGYQVNVTTAGGKTTLHDIENLATGDQKRRVTASNGAVTETIQYTNGTKKNTQPDGTIVNQTLSPDPRFGMQAPFVSLQTVFTGGLTKTVSSGMSVEPASLTDPMAFTKLTQTESINGRTQTSVFDKASLTRTVTSAAGRQSYTKLDNLGRVIEAGLTGIEPYRFGYDQHGHLTSAAQGTGNNQRLTTIAYGDTGYLQSITNALNLKTSFSHDDAGRVTQQILANANKIQFGYDAGGNLLSLQPPGQPEHTFTYNAVNQAIGYTPPDLGQGATATTYQTNLDKQLTQVLTPDLAEIDFDYNSAGQIKTLTIPEGSYQFAFDNAGRINQVVAPGNQELAFSFNGALLASAAWNGDIAGSIVFAYDNDFRIANIKVNNANVVSYQYDADSLLTQVGDLQYQRNADNGLLTGSTLANVHDAIAYNGFAEPISYVADFNGAELFKQSFVRDKLGRITQKSETVGNATTVYDYSYDAIGQLTSVSRNNALYSSYQYDANGNRTWKSSGGQIVTGTYDAQDRLLSYGSAQYAYNKSGELRTKTVNGQTTQYQYDVLGNLRSVKFSDNTQIDYVIDGQNRRVGKKVNGALVQGFLYENQLRPIAELDAAGNIVSRFVYGNHVNVPDYMIKGGVTYRIITDHLGSPRLIVDIVTGNVAQRMAYSEFGRVLTDSNPGFQPFGFAGGLYDRDTKWVRFGARDYDAEVGRWTSKDPIRFNSREPNLYKYSINDPINVVDYYGLEGTPRTDFFDDMTELGAALYGSAKIYNKTAQYIAREYLIKRGFIPSLAIGAPTSAAATGLALFVIFEGAKPLLLGDYGPEFGIPKAYEDLVKAYDSIYDLLEYQLDKFWDDCD